MMKVNRNYPTTPSLDELKSSIFTSKEQTSSIIPNELNSEINPNTYALNLTPITGIHTSINNLSLNEQLRLERDIAHQSSIITRDSFTSTYSSLQTMLSQMQLKVAAAFLQETEYLQQREQKVEYEEQLLIERNKQLENLRHEREHMEEDFLQIKNRLDSAVIQVTKFKTDGAQILQTLFSESRQIDEQLSELISESMASLVRTRSIMNSKTNNFIEKSDDVHTELNDRTTLIRNTESTITMMLELINILNQLNIEHSQDLSIAKTDFDIKNQEFIDLSQTLKHNWDIKKEIEHIRLLENEKIQVQKELLEQTLLLENLKTILQKKKNENNDSALFVLTYGPYICFLLTLLLMITGLILIGAYTYEDYSFPLDSISNNTQDRQSYDLHSLRTYAKYHEATFSHERYVAAEDELIKDANSHFHTTIGWATGYEIIAATLMFIVTALSFLLMIASRSEDI
ncbi:unnamed protein product [Rotaria sordida]|uniref:Uncharacterized protein n=2 Tax=Rotaria sordida TaxID=392033 RepID=A0A814RVQ6_9BILA|nr:unnamed protein product [Rotaria sordida]